MPPAARARLIRVSLEVGACCRSPGDTNKLGPVYRQFGATKCNRLFCVGDQAMFVGSESEAGGTDQTDARRMRQFPAAG